MKKNILISVALAGLMLFCGCDININNFNTGNDPAPIDPVKPVVTTEPDETDPVDIEEPEDEGPIDYEFDFDAHNPAEWQKAYRDMLPGFIPAADADGNLWDTNYYFLMDVDDHFNTNIPELFIKTGTCEADYTLEVYAFNDSSNKVETLVDTNALYAGHSTFYQGPSGDLYQYNGHMGYYTIVHYTSLYPKLESEIIKEGELGNDPDEDYPSMSSILGDIVKPADFIPVQNNAAILWYNNYSFPTAYKNVEKAEAALSKVASDNAQIYMVGDGSYYYSGKTGLINFNDLTKHDTYDAYTTDDYKFTRYIWVDANKDGQKELLYELKLDKVDYDHYLYVLLSYQDRGIFAYVMNFYDSQLSVCEYDPFRMFCTTGGYPSFYGLVFDKTKVVLMYNDNEVKEADKKVSDGKWINY